MCGIFGVINDQTNQAGNIVLQGLKKLEYRGYDSWGIATKTQANKLFIEKHIGKIGEVNKIFPPGLIALGHTRWATHGGVTDVNAHPHLDCTKKIVVIHNGIVENYRELKSSLKKIGHRFCSETDTEVIAHLIEEEVKTKAITKAVIDTFNQLTGSNAIAVLDYEHELILSCRNGSPIVVGLGKNEYFLASDVTPFLHKTNKVLFVNDLEGVVLSKTGVKLYSLKTGKEKQWQTQTIDWQLEDAQKAGYPHYLIKEIMEQKTTISKTANLSKKAILSLAAKINQGYKVVLIGCGTASYCTQAAKYFFSQNEIETQAYGAYEFLPFSKFCNKKTILIAVSQSGETADTLIAVKVAKKRGAFIAAVVNAVGSTLERLANCVLKVGAGPEIAVVSTKTFTSQLATLYLLARAAKGQYQLARQEIDHLGQLLNNWLNDKLCQKIMNLVKKFINEEDFYLIGKHINYPAVLEFALKIKETSYVHAEAFASGELKHGVISLIQKNIPCFVLAANDEVKTAVLSSAMEIKSRGGTIIGIAPFKAHEFDYQIITPDAGDLSIFVNVIVGQLFGYYLGVGRGADPDKPRNLAKSVTVV